MTYMRATLQPFHRDSLDPAHSPPARGLDVELLGTGDDLTVRLRGEAGFTDAAELEASLCPLCAQGFSSVTFDLSELRFISSLGLAALIRYRRGAVRNGIRVLLADNLQPMVLDLFQTTGILGLFEASGPT